MTKKWVYGAVCAAVVVTFGLACAGCEKSSKKPRAQLAAAEQKAEATGAPKNAAPKVTAESDFEVGLTEDSEGIVINKYVGKGGAVIIPATIQGFPVREIGDQAFAMVGDVTGEGFTDLRTVVIPDGVTNIGMMAFYANAGLISVDVPASVKSIGSSAFGDTGLTAVTIYAGKTYDSMSGYTGYGVYNSCTALKTVTIQDGVTVIDVSLFSGCTSLTTVSLPDSVVEIKGSAFRGCANLTTVTFSPDIKRKWSDSAFENCPKLPLATQAALRKAGYTGGF